MPANIQALARRTAAIEETFKGLCENFKTHHWAATEGQWDLTEFVRLFVFQEWITSRKAEIKAELRRAYEQSANRGSPWTESIAESYRNIDAFVDEVTALRNNLSEIFSRAILTNSDREKFFDLIRKEQALYCVDELTYRVVSSSAAPFVVALKK